MEGAVTLDGEHRATLVMVVLARIDKVPHSLFQLVLSHNKFAINQTAFERVSGKHPACLVTCLLDVHEA